MFQLVADCAQSSIEALQQDAVTVSERNAIDGTAVVWQPNMKDILSRFSHDVIALVAFGTEVNSIRHRNNRFYVMAMRALDFNSWASLGRVLLASWTYKLGPRFRWRWFQADIVQHFNTIVLDAIKYRAKYNVQRNDMIQMMMAA